MNNERLIQKIEELSINAFPSLQTQLVDGWLLRFSDGYSKRANSINPIYRSSGKTCEKIKMVEQVYQERNLPVMYKLTSRVFPENLDNILEQADYSLEALTSVQVLSLHEFSVPFQSSSTSAIYNSFEDQWFKNFCELNSMKESDQLILKKMLERIVPKACYVVLYNDKKDVVACGMGVLEDDYLGLFDIVTNPKERNKGYGMQLLLTILNWGKTNGAKDAYLQVVPDNFPALHLYAKLGFTEAYKYWYRIKRFE